MSRILLVGPDDPAGGAIAPILAMEGHEVTVVSRDLEAAETARRERPDLLIYDLEILAPAPLYSLDRFLDDPYTARMPALFLSPSDAVFREHMTGLEMEPADVLLAPFSPEDLAERTRQALHRRGGLLRMFGFPPNGTGRHKPTILVVDDTQLIRRTARKLLEMEGYHVIEAEDGAEALDLLGTHTVHTIVLDVMMPRMDGYTALREMKNDPHLQWIPVILCTAKNQREDVLRAKLAGVADYLVKPFTKDTLLSRVNRHAGPA